MWMWPRQMRTAFVSVKIGYAEFCVRVGDPLAGRQA